MAVRTEVSSGHVKDAEIHTLLWTPVLQHVGVLLLGIAVFCLMLWCVFSKQDSKLYEADNVVCVSQPGAVQCFERKPR